MTNPLVASIITPIVLKHLQEENLRLIALVANIQDVLVIARESCPLYFTLRQMGRMGSESTTRSLALSPSLLRTLIVAFPLIRSLNGDDLRWVASFRP